MRDPHYGHHGAPRIADRRIVATYLGTYKSKRVYRYPVRIRVNNPAGTIADWINPTERWISVDAISQSDVARYVWEFESEPCTEIKVYGPHGGEREFYQGYESAIGRAMWRNHAIDAIQLTMIGANGRTAETEGLL